MLCLTSDFPFTVSCLSLPLAILWEFGLGDWEGPLLQIGCESIEDTQFLEPEEMLGIGMKLVHVR